MWLWIACGILVGLVWVIWLLPWNPSWVTWLADAWLPLALTAAIVVAAVGILLLRRVVAERASKALERGLSAQAEREKAEAKGARRAEIHELELRFRESIKTLRQSKLGRRGREAALYALPWYVIIGPPGAGKTTALLASGLSFPYHDAGGVRGVGGTRNCDWWFADGAILLDTAGRYTSEAADHEEWLGFLRLLRENRPKAPLNGVLIAVGVDALLDAREGEIEELGATLRARIDELEGALRMTLPVYVLFTKLDLVAGFVECFGDLPKSRRAEAWGATFPLASGPIDARARFDAELDTLLSRLHVRVLERLAASRSLDEKARIFHFPLEFAELKAPLGALLAKVFEPRRTADEERARAPLFRGFYFTSGTQEGRPLDRVLAGMRSSFGAPPAEPAAASPPEPRSYFLHDVFTRIIFPDKDVAAQTEAEVRRRRVARALATAASWTFALTLIALVASSFSQNQALVGEIEELPEIRAARAGADPCVPWERDPKAALQSIERLSHYVGELEGRGRPFGRLGTASLLESMRGLYLQCFREALITPIRSAIEGEITKERCDGWGRQADALKLHDLLYRSSREGQRPSNDGAAEVGLLVDLWARHLAIPPDVDRSRLEERARLYVSLVTADPSRIPASPGSTSALLDAARARLAEPACYYDRFVAALAERRAKGASEPEFPPVVLGALLKKKPQHAAALAFLRADAQVDGIYTSRARAAVKKTLSIKAVCAALDDDAWFLPYDRQACEERGDGRAPMRDVVDRLTADYEQRYVDAWTALLRASIADPVGDPRQALRLLVQADPPYAPLFAELDAQTRPIGEPTDKRRSCDAPKRAELVGDALCYAAAFGYPYAASPLQAYIEELAKISSALESGAPADALAGHIRAAREHVLSKSKAALDAPGYNAIERLLLGPIDAAAGALRAQTRGELSRTWNDVLGGEPRGALAALKRGFPFTAGAADVDLTRFDELLRPSGALASFRRAVTEAGVASDFGPALTNCLAAAAEVSEALWAGSARPHLALTVRLKSAAPSVSRVSVTTSEQSAQMALSDAGEPRKFTAELAKDAYITIKAMGPGAPDVELQVIQERGPFAFLRLMRRLGADRATLSIRSPDLASVLAELEVRLDNRRLAEGNFFSRMTSCPTAVAATAEGRPRQEARIP